jgi:hypothetical protein
MQAPDRREWPRTEMEIYLLCSEMFTAPTADRDMETARRGEEVEEIARSISNVVPELQPETDDDDRRKAHSTAAGAMSR